MNVNPTQSGYLQMDLSNYAKGVRQGDDPTDEIFPRVEVMRQTDAYPIAGREILQRTEQTLRAPGTPAAETRLSMSRDTYFCQSRALKTNIPDENRQTWPGDLNRSSTKLNMGKILHDRSYRAMLKVTNTSNYAASHTVALSGSAQWDDGTSNPLLIGKKARTVMGRDAAVRPNRLLLGFDVAEALRVHPQLLQKYQYTTVTGQLSDQQIAQIFNVEKVIIGSTVTGDPAGAAPNVFDWSNFALFFYTQTTPGAAGVIDNSKPVGGEGTLDWDDVSFGKSFTWINAPQTVGGYGVVVGRHPDPTAKSDIVGVDWYTDEKITGADAGFLVTNVLGTPGGN